MQVDNVRLRRRLYIPQQHSNSYSTECENHSNGTWEGPHPYTVCTTPPSINSHVHTSTPFLSKILYVCVCVTSVNMSQMLSDRIALNAGSQMCTGIVYTVCHHAFSRLSTLRSQSAQMSCLKGFLVSFNILNTVGPFFSIYIQTQLNQKRPRIAYHK